MLDSLTYAGIESEKVIARLDDLQFDVMRRRRDELDSVRRYEAKRTRVLRLSELESLRIPTLRGRFGTAKNGTYVPDIVPFDEDFWYVVGLFLAEGHIGKDGQRTRICDCDAPDRVDG